MSDQDSIPEDRALTTTGWVMPPATVEQRMKEIEEYRRIMRQGEDYGVIPGTEKPTLFQPGADTLCRAAGLVTGPPEIVNSVEDWDKPLFYYLIRQPLFTLDGQLAGYGMGSCNSMESRYRNRWVPLFTLSDELKQRANEEGWPREQRPSKRGNDVTWVLSQNQDLFSLVNTIQKMAVKRAYVSATLRATGAHRIFTQDIEDMGPVVDGEVISPEPTRRASPAKAALRPSGKTAARPPAEYLVHKLDERFGPQSLEAIEWLRERAPDAVARNAEGHYFNAETVQATMGIRDITAAINALAQSEVTQ